MSRLGSLRNLILKAKHAYYYSNEPVMTDLEYDAIEDELRVLAPDDPILALVGSCLCLRHEAAVVHRS
jgi:NAD-dependent DNA ligase